MFNEGDISQKIFMLVKLVPRYPGIIVAMENNSNASL